MNRMNFLAYTLSYIHLHLGHLADACQKKEKQQYIAVGTVRMLIEPSAKH